MERIKLVIADDDAGFRSLLLEYFSSRSEFEVLGTATDGSEAAAESLKHRPHVVLCDIDMPGMDGLQVTELLKKVLPDTAVIIISGNDYGTFSKKAMEAGARGFLSKPCELTQVEQQVLKVMGHLNQVAESVSQRQEAADSRSKMFAFYSPKGSAGSTSLAVNSAVELARARLPTLLVDLNLQFGDIEFLLDMKTKACLSELVNENGELITFKIPNLAEPHNSGLKVLYQHRLEDSELITATHMAVLLKYLRATKDFEFVLLDLPRQLDERTLTAIDSSDCVFVVVTEDYLALKNARLCMELFKKLGYSEKKVKVLVNKVKGAIDDHVRTHLGAPFATFPLQAELFEKSVKSGFPPIVEEPNSPFSQAVTSLVNGAILMKKAPESPVVEQPGGIGSLFKKLFR